MLSKYSHLIKKLDLTKMRPYGDIMDDGVVQISFTLPVPVSPEAREAAMEFAKKMGLEEIKITTMEKVAGPAEEANVLGFSFFVIYGKLKHTLDYTKIKAIKVETPVLSREEIDELIKNKIGRKLVVLGACTGYDAHTVGIDAIMNMKGFAGDYGLERYEMLEAKNLGAQVLNEELLKKAIEEKADVILVSKIVTQHNIHVQDMKDLIEKAEKMGLKDKIIFVSGGPRITHQLALECGFDAGFGIGTRPSEVASFFVQEFIARQNKNNKKE
jgi:beta-lysine 5,6-aminomutase beta subunit